MPTAQMLVEAAHAVGEQADRTAGSCATISGLNTFSSKLPRRAAEVDRDVVAEHLAAEHRQRLALRRVHLARHDRAARLVLRNRDLADARSAARSRASGRRWRSSSGAAASVFSAPCATTSASCAASASNLFGAVTKRQAGQLAESRARRVRANSRMRVQPGADRRAAQRQLDTDAAAPRRRARRRGRAARRSRRTPGPSVSGVASCRCVRPIFTMCVERLRLAVERVAQRLQRGHQVASRSRRPRRRASRSGTRRSTTARGSRRRSGARGALRRAAPPRSLAGAVGDHLVDVHVGLRAGARSARRRAEIRPDACRR